MGVRVSTCDEVTAVIAHMLGFEPHESLVVMPMTSDLPVARIDVPRTHADRVAATEALLHPYLRNAGADSKIALVVFTESGRVAEEASRHVGEEMSAHGLPVVLRLWASGDSWTDLDTGRGGARTSETQTRMAVAFVAEGRRAPAATRAHLAEAFAGDTGPVAAELEAMPGRITQPAAERAWAAERISTFERDGNRLCDSETARLLLAVRDTATRDDALMRITRANSSHHRALWTDVTSRAPEQVRTPAATMAAFAAWLGGDGAGAWTALDQIPTPSRADAAPEHPTAQRAPEAGERSSGSFGGYALAGMLAQALEEGVNPASWDSKSPTTDRSDAPSGNADGSAPDVPDSSTRLPPGPRLDGTADKWPPRSSNTGRGPAAR